jgi:endo-1,4-beta-xylanase
MLRNLSLLLLTCGLVLICVTISFAQAAAVPTAIISPNDITALSFYGSQYGSGTLIQVEGQSFKQAWQVKTSQQPSQEYALRLMAKTSAALIKGDLISVSFWARCIEPSSGKGLARFVIERAADPYTKTAYVAVPITNNWRKYHITIPAVESYEPGQAQLFFSLGYSPQTIEIGGLSALNHGPIGYLGQAQNAAWRKAAEERIDKIRKANISVVVKDRDGRVIPSANVKVRMLKHKFGFGSAVAASGIMDQTDNGNRYREIIKTLYNKVVIENDLKWPNWEILSNRQQTLNALDWLRNNRIDIRGHTLVWPSWRWMPKDVETLKDNPEALRSRVNNHILEEAGALKDRLVEWDVLNEPYDNHDLMDILGKQEMVEWFKLAHQADKNAYLYINDYSILASGGFDFLHQDHYEETIRYLIEQAAPIDGIGFQSHFDNRLTPPERLVEILDRFAKYGKTLQATEFDIDITDEKLQADYLRDYMTTLFSHPSVNGIIMWGFWEGRHWRPNAALYRRDWSIKPNGEAWIDLVKNRWWTNTTGTTGTDGKYSVRGFLGDYEIEVSKDGKVSKLQTSVDNAGRNISITLGDNLLNNSGFEEDGTTVNNISGWISWSSENNLDADQTQTPGAHSGKFYATHWKATPYDIWTYQKKTGLQNGLYTLRAWVRSSGGQREVQIGAVLNGGNTWLYTNIPKADDWIQVTLPNINITNGECEIGFWSNAYANQWLDFDTVEFFKQ